MPRFIAKLADNKYVEWSTIVDAPVSYVMSKEAMTNHVNDPTRMERVEKHGTSCLSPMTAEELVRGNRAGEGEKELSLQEILVKYDRATVGT